MLEDTVTIGSRKLELTNPDKVFWSSAGLTKRDMVGYYIEVADVLLPHLKGHPVTLKRYPEGAEGDFFYEKSCPDHRPKWLHTAEIVRKRDDKPMRYCLLDNLSSLVWAANLATLELHVSPATVPHLDRPRSVVFDLDPGEGRAVLDCAEVALRLRDLLGERGLDTVVKTSGSKGLQVYVPLNSASASYDAAKALARALARRLEKAEPDLVTSNIRKSERRGRVLIDWSQNSEHKTTVCVYSLRAKARPMVSTPVSWDEVDSAAARADAGALEFECEETIDRIKRHGDLFEPAHKLRQKLPPEPE